MKTIDIRIFGGITLLVIIYPIIMIILSYLTMTQQLIFVDLIFLFLIILFIISIKKVFEKFLEVVK